MNLARSSVRVFVANSGSSFVSFLGIAFFARELGAHQIGIFFLFQALLGVVAIPADFGIRSGLTKRISEGGPSGSVLSTAVLLKIVLLTPFIAAILLLESIINEYLGAELALYLVVALILQESSNLTIHVLKGELRVGETAGPVFLQRVVYIGSASLLIIEGFGVRGIICGLFAGLAVTIIWAGSKCSINLGVPSLEQARSLFDYSKYAFISSIGGYFYSWMDVAIIGFFLSQSSVGIYEVAWRVTAVVMLFSTAISTTIFPQVSQWDSEGAMNRIESMLSEAIAPALFIAIPAFFGVVLFSEEILGFVFGAEYSAGWLVLVILMGEKVIQSVHTILGRSLQGINRPDLAARAGIIAIIINFFLNIILILEYGIVGAAVATTISFVVNSILHAYYLSNFVTFQFPFEQIAGCVVASVGMTLTLLILESMVVINNLPKLVMVILFGVVIYFGFVLTIPSSRKVVFKNIRRVV
ncbi:polysaccharide biosynthesis C-terminal domain-containing protein [Natronomonas gomsonensis]|uniref:oligosaccharide flippase family protein n=1 Tax=Natronomonas gomsonensis TaxID=1046043 RepID=UPI0020CA8F01|nr:polysaccharide biosynthesis C-terminal domain-containing protein [Natronomonas gomsonensis]MCY4732433.1 polysaccharide biosynthesis C-terminal domain-containing protein [Natronomonas gomsonensis]